MSFRKVTKTRIAIISFLFGFSCGILSTTLYIFVSTILNTLSVSIYDLF